MAEPLGPAPKRMEAQLTHDGVTWRYTPDLGDLVSPLAMFLVLAGAAVTSLGLTYGLPLAALAAAAAAAVAVVITARVKRAERVMLTDRTLTVEVRRLLTTERTVLRLDDLEMAKLTMEGTCVVFRTADTLTSVGVGQPRDHVAWFARAVGVALGEVESREQAEGREYTFMRTAPEALRALKEPTSISDPNKH